jgi:Uma2 family endonuclease
MNSTVPLSGPKLMTTEELFALRPNKKIDRWLFRGELGESTARKRTPVQASIMASCCYLLGEWRNMNRSYRGQIYGGGVCVRLRKDPDTVIELDLAVTSELQEQELNVNSRFIDGSPPFAIGLVPFGTQGCSSRKIVDECLACGVRCFWTIDHSSETVSVHRPGLKTKLYRSTHTLPGGVELPGFECLVSKLFE